jgi:hypothetical protein
MTENYFLIVYDTERNLTVFQFGSSKGLEEHLNENISRYKNFQWYDYCSNYGHIMSPGNGIIIKGSAFLPNVVRHVLEYSITE